MRPHCWIVALAFALPLFAQDDEELVVEEEESDGTAAGTLSREERDQPAVSVRLGAEGALQVKRGEEWKEVSLESLAKALDEESAAYDKEMQAKGGSGYELVGSVHCSQLFVSIEADPTAPWQHVQWVMILAAERKCRKLELSDGKRRMLAFLPVDRGIGPKLVKPPKEIRVSVHVMARKEAPRTWNGQQVAAPTSVVYRFGERDTEDLKAVAEWIREAKKAAQPEVKSGAVLVGEIKGGHKVPFAMIFDVMAAFVDEDLPAVAFYGCAAPSPEQRGTAVLPYPVKNY